MKINPQTIRGYFNKISCNILESLISMHSGFMAGIQYLRFSAALLVVLYHSWQMVVHVGKGDIGKSFVGGSIGVDIFFVISGFIMIFITSDSARRSMKTSTFLIDRLTRVAPTYWILTVLMAVVIYTVPSLLRSESLDLNLFIASMLFIPWSHTALHGAWPVLQLGWTLNYEMFFYLIFSISIGLTLRYRTAVCSIAIVSIWIICKLAEESSVFSSFYGSGFVFEFIFGMLIAEFTLRYRIQRGVAISLLTSAAFIIILIAMNYPMYRDSAERFALWGLPSAFLVMMVAYNDINSKIKEYKFLIILGNASYSLYLTHLFTIGLVRFVWSRIPMANKPSDIYLIAVSVLASIAVGLFFYYLAEKPAIKISRSFLNRNSVNSIYNYKSSPICSKPKESQASDATLHLQTTSLRRTPAFSFTFMATCFL